MPDDLEIPASEGPVAADGTVPLFDARYRWVLLFALRWLREEPDLGLDLDAPEQLGLAYALLSKMVQGHVRERGLGGKVDPMRVSAIAESRSVRQTVEDILRREHPADWKSMVAGPEVRQLIEQGVRTADPS